MRTARIILLLASLLAACGDDDDSPGASGAITSADFPARANAAYCKALSSCCPAAGITYDAAACQEHRVVDQDKWDGLLSLTSLQYSAEAAGACVAALEASCPASDDLFDLPACRSLLTGSLAAGQACTIDLECTAPPGQQAECYHQGDDDSGGVCVVITTDVPAGAACSDETGTVCAAGLFCDSTGHCAADLAPGSPCTFHEGCAGGTCSFSTQTCVVYPALGQPCDPACADDAYCQFKDASGKDAVCASIPCPGGTCVARKPRGSSCEVSDECVDHLYCVSGHCQPEALYSCSNGTSDETTGSP